MDSNVSQRTVPTEILNGLRSCEGIQRSKVSFSPASGTHELIVLVSSSALRGAIYTIKENCFGQVWS